MSLTNILLLSILFVQVGVFARLGRAGQRRDLIIAYLNDITKKLYESDR